MNLGYSEIKCKEVYEYLKKYFPQGQDYLLNELAWNFKYDALSPAETSDFLQVLLQPGPMKTYTLEIADENNAVPDIQALIERIASEGINLNAVAGTLLIIKSYTLKNPKFHQLTNILHQFDF